MDTETRDPRLKTHGPGGVRGDGYVVGISLATEDGFAAYYPIAHEAGGNLDRGTVLRYVRDQMARDNQEKVGANLLYDLEWLRASGVEVKGPKVCVQVAEALLNESRHTYRLDALAQDYLGTHKEETLLLEAAQQMKIKEKDIKGNIWRFHSQYVGPYGEADAVLPLRIYEKQRPLLEEQGLMRVFDLECRLIDVLLAMRFQGIRIDEEKAHQARAELTRQQQQAQAEINRLVGFPVDIWANASIEKACHRLRIPFPRTAKGAPSFTKDWLAAQEHPFFQQLLNVRQIDRAGSVYIQSKVIDLAHNGRVFPMYRQARGERGGTETGRFSSDSPNLQQVPGKGEMGKLTRSVFLPEPGKLWASLDWASQEPRVMTHYAHLLGLPGIGPIVEAYRQDPTLSFHKKVAEMAGLDKDKAKIVNLGLAYGMGQGKLREALGMSLLETQNFLKQYHKEIPFVAKLSENCSAVAQRKGFVRTILGRRRRFNMWAPARYTPSATPLPYEQALENYGAPLRRAFTHKALNSIIQGSSADMVKTAMVRVFEELGVTPLASIHDELAFSVTRPEDVKPMQEIMLHPFEKDLAVPMHLDVAIGPSWGEVVDV